MITPELITKCCNVCGCPTKEVKDGLCSWCYKFQATRKRDLVWAAAWFLTIGAIVLLLVFMMMPT